MYTKRSGGTNRWGIKIYQYKLAKCKKMSIQLSNIHGQKKWGDERGLNRAQILHLLMIIERGEQSLKQEHLNF